MKITLNILLTILFLTFLLGCAKTYQSIAPEKFIPKLYEGQRVLVSGVPQKPAKLDFVPPTPAHEGYWHVKINGIVFREGVNFENAPRIRAIRLMAKIAHEKNRKVKVAGKVKNGIVELESFNGMRTDTPWYKNPNPHYSYTAYYQWYPFAYEPNEWAIR